MWKRSTLLTTLAGCLVLASCTKANPTANLQVTARPPSPTAITQPTELPIVNLPQITDLNLDKAWYRPGETVHLTGKIFSQVGQPVQAQIIAQVTYITMTLATIEQSIVLQGGSQTFEFSWVPPKEAPRGYGLDLTLKTPTGETWASASTAFDVLERWTQAPRYGFLSDFPPNRSDIPETMAQINRFHLNALQFYDWMYRHEQLLTNQEPYQDPMGRTLSRTTVDKLISAAHQYNIAAMPYTAVYAASVDFYQQHPDWAIYGVDGKPLLFGENFLVYMDPRPNSPWTQHLLAQFDQVLEQTAFDGIHLDQYRDPKVGYDQQGQSYNLDTVLAEFINLTHQHVMAHRTDGAVVFNAVTNWPIETVAPSDEDIVYIEVWSPYTWFNELHHLIVQAQNLGNGKAVVLAAYISPSLEHNVRLVDAIIFASGGGHIELGEQDGMLADPYFPRYERLSSDLADVMRRYYDFAVRYEDVIGPSSQDATEDYSNRIEVQGVSTNPGQVKDTIMPLVRETPGYTAISLVNLLDLTSPEWKVPEPDPPTALGPTMVRISGVQRTIRQVWVASPDGNDLSPQNLEFGQIGDQISLQLPGLEYWSMVLIEWGE
jgi:dextranase